MNRMRPPSAFRDAAPSDGSFPKKRHGRFAWIGTVASVVLFGISLVVLWHVVSDVDMAELRSAFTAASARQIGLAILFTAMSYGLLTCYDALALRQLKLEVPYRTTALASFTSYAVSFTLGFPLLTAGTVRYWIYAPRGISAGPRREPDGDRRHDLLARDGPGPRLEPDRQADERRGLVYYTSIKLNQLIGLAGGGPGRRLSRLGLAEAPRRDDPGLAPGTAGLSPLARADADRRGRRLRRRRRALRAAAGRARHRLRDLPRGLRLRRHARRREPLAGRARRVRGDDPARPVEHPARADARRAAAFPPVLLSRPLRARPAHARRLRDPEPPPRGPARPWSRTTSRS